MISDHPFLYQKIALSFRKRIIAGELSPGDRLPPVREVAQQWGATPATVNRAYQVLTEEGLVTSQRGKGTVVAEKKQENSFAGSSYGWANLIHKAESLLLEGLHAGYSETEVLTALEIAILRWNELKAGPQTIPQPKALPQQKTLRFAGSHDMLIDLLPRLLKSRGVEVNFSLEYVGSLAGLMRLALGEADFAGCHLWDENAAEFNVPFVRRIFPTHTMLLVTLVQRQIGLLLPKGNPEGITGLTDITRPGVVFINRQAGSGIRIWLDTHLRALGIRPGDIRGYEQETTTHLGVAGAIVDGSANIGLGTSAAASSYHLDFLPLTKERYDLVFPKAVTKNAEVSALLNLIRSDEFHEVVNALGGYDTAETGKEIWVNP